MLEDLVGVDFIVVCPVERRAISLDRVIERVLSPEGSFREAIARARFTDGKPLEPGPLRFVGRALIEWRPWPRWFGFLEFLELREPLRAAALSLAKELGGRRALYLPDCGLAREELLALEDEGASDPALRAMFEDLAARARREILPALQGDPPEEATFLDTFEDLDDRRPLGVLEEKLAARDRLRTRTALPAELKSAAERDRWDRSAVVIGNDVTWVEPFEPLDVSSPEAALLLSPDGFETQDARGRSPGGPAVDVSVLPSDATRLGDPSKLARAVRDRPFWTGAIRITRDGAPWVGWLHDREDPGQVLVRTPWPRPSGDRSDPDELIASSIARMLEADAGTVFELEAIVQDGFGSVLLGRRDLLRLRARNVTLRIVVRRDDDPPYRDLGSESPA